MMTIEEIAESINVVFEILIAIKDTLQVQGKSIQLSNEAVILQQQRINNLEEQVKALVQNTHTHSVVYGHMQKPDNFDATGISED